jgi:succinyl-diaminopimelate desuccinylase
MIKKIVNLSKKLIKIESTSHNTVNLNKILDLTLDNLSEYKIEKFNNKGTRSALIYNTSNRPEKFKILFNAHLDVVPGKPKSYEPKVSENKLFGTGAMDMKSNAACLILLFNLLGKKVSYPFGLQLTTDEEVGGFKGTKYQIEKGVNSEFVIAGESTGLNIVNRSKGVLWLKIISKGKSFHGAYPWKGDNAILKMNLFLNKLTKLFPNKEKPWQTTVNISDIESNNKSYNKIPDQCNLNLDIRYVPEESKTIIKKIKKILPRNFLMEIIVNEPPVYTKPDNKYLLQLLSSSKKILNKEVEFYSSNGSSDARHFSYIGSSGIEFGAKGGSIGSDKEWVSIKSLEQYYLILKDFLLSLE